MATDLWTYLTTIVVSWYALLATGIFTVLSLAGPRWPRANVIARWVAVLGMSFVASFQAWRAERARYSSLEARTSDAQPLTLDQEHRMRAVLAQGRGLDVQIAALSADRHGREFARRIQEAFTESGWGVGSGGGSAAGSGRSLRILSDEPNTKTVSMIMTAFNAAGLHYRVFRVCQNTPAMVEIGEAEVERGIQ
jgi:hypothetical protein